MSIKEGILKIAPHQYGGLLALFVFGIFFSQLLQGYIAYISGVKRKKASFAPIRRYLPLLFAFGSITVGGRNLLQLDKLIPSLLWVGDCIVFLLAVRLINPISNLLFVILERKALKKKTEHRALLQVIRSITKVVLWILAIGCFPALIYDDYEISSWLKSFSIGAGTLTAIVALASKDLVANLFSSLMISITKPFTIGDWIAVSGVEGVVKNVDLRSVALETESGTLIQLPNSTFLNAKLQNYGQSLYIKISTPILLHQATPEVINTFIEEVKAMLQAYEGLLAEQSRIETKDLGGFKTTLALHLFLTEEEKERKTLHLGTLQGQVMALAQKHGLLSNG